MSNVKEGGLCITITDYESKIITLKASFVSRLKDTKHCI